MQLIQFGGVKPIDYRHKNQIDYDADAGTTSVNQENMPKEFTFAFFGKKEAPVLIVKGAGIVSIKNFFGSYRNYSLELSEKSTIVESTAFFRGWQTKVNGKKISYLDNDVIGGRIAYELEAGNYQVSSRFTQRTWPRLIGNGISAIALVIFLISLFFCWRQKDRKNKK